MVRLSIELVSSVVRSFIWFFSLDKLPTPLQSIYLGQGTGGSPFFAFLGLAGAVKKKASRKTGSPRPKQAGTAFSIKQTMRICDQVRTLAEPVCEAQGYELIHVEFQPEAGGRIMRLYIDKPGGVNLDDCVHVSRQVNDILDVSLEAIGPYQLEVSSPGPERPLGRPLDYERYKDRLVRLKTRQPIEGQKNFTGRLMGLVDHQVHLSINGKTVAIPYDAVLRARLVDSGVNPK
jgi:ribosome maturation factor RimP